MSSSPINAPNVDGANNTQRGLECLNEDCLREIFRYLDIFDLHAICQVSPWLKKIVNSFNLNGTLQAGTNCLCTLKRTEQSIYLKSVLRNVGRHIQTLFIDLDNIRNSRATKIMDAIQRYCLESLQNLSIKKWKNLELSEYQTLFARLRTLRLERCRGFVSPGSVRAFYPYTVTDEVLLNLGQLELFSMINCENILDADDTSLFVLRNQRLRCLQLLRYTINGYYTLPLSLTQMSNLQFLTLHMDSKQVIDLTPLANIKTLRSLQLAHVNNSLMTELVRLCNILYRIFLAFRDHEKLEELILDYCLLSGRCHLALADMQSLRHISLRKHYWGTDPIFQKIAAQGKFRTIGLFDCPCITNAGLLGMVRSCPDLEMVDASWCTKLSSELVNNVYDIISNRPRPKKPFELFLGGTTHVNMDDEIVPTMDPSVMRVLFDAKLSVNYPSKRYMRTVLEEIQREEMCNDGESRLPSNPPFAYATESDHVFDNPQDPNMYVSDPLKYTRFHTPQRRFRRM